MASGKKWEETEMKSLGAVVCAKILRTEGCAPTTPFGEFCAKKISSHNNTQTFYLHFFPFFPSSLLGRTDVLCEKMGLGGMQEVCELCMCALFTEAHRSPPKAFENAP
jgi:hypothetical protein